MIIYERLRYLAKGGKKDYLHGLKENKKTRQLQDFLDEVYKRNPSFYRRFN